MSSTSTIPPTHVPCATEWPALSPLKISSHDHHGTDNDWELLPELHDGSVQTSFERDAVRIVEPLRNEIEGVDTQDESSAKKLDSTEDKPHCLKHAQSTPDFRHYDTIMEESDIDAEAVLIESYGEDENEDDVGSLASSSIVMVSGPSSVISSQSSWSASPKVSFRDAIMKPQTTDSENHTTTGKGSEEQARQQKTLRKKPKFVVKPIRRCSKSTGDLQSLTRIAEDGEDDLVLGDTDAELYYNQKAQGKLGRKNGRKTRPDEAKRLQISMAKKDDQRQRQQAAASKKR